MSPSSPDERRLHVAALAAVVVATLILLPGLPWVLECSTNDAAYYLECGRNIARGQGLEESSLWHFMGRRDSIQGPAFDHWMPLESILIAGSLTLFGESIGAAIVPNFLLTVLFAAVVLVWAIRSGIHPFLAPAAAILALTHPRIFSHAFMIFAVPPYAIFGTLAVMIFARREPPGDRVAFLVGCLLGLSSLSRNDTTMLVVAVVTFVLLGSGRRGPRLAGAIVLGFVIIMLPLFLRILECFGKLLPLGSKAPWFIHYSDRYSWGRVIGPELFIAQGAVAILRQKVHAMIYAFEMLSTMWPVWAWIPIFLSLARSARSRSGAPEDPARPPASPFWLMLAAWLSVALLTGAWGLQPTNTYMGSSLLVGITALHLMAGWQLTFTVAARRLRSPWIERAGQLVMYVLVVTRLQSAYQDNHSWVAESVAAASIYKRVTAHIREEASLSGKNPVLMTTSPWEMHSASGWPTVQVPDDPEPIQREVVERFGVTHVVLGRGFSPLVCPGSAGMDRYSWLRKIETLEWVVDIFEVVPVLDSGSETPMGY